MPNVTVHTGAQATAAAAAVQARAFTIGHDIVFGAREYAPDTIAGQRLLAHELAHAVQQSGVRDPGSVPVEISSPHDSSEREADSAAEYVVSRRAGGDLHGQDPVLRPAPPLIQRTCGTALGDPPAKCQASATPVIGQHFTFVVNCDDLQPDEATHLATYARGLRAGTQLHIHGYASEEGPAGFNHTLSCHRANTVAAKLRAHRPDCAVVAVYEHGAQALPPARSFWRAAIVQETHPQAPAGPEDCGHRVGNCEFYRCRQRRAPSGFPVDGYYLGYGLKYCERFSTVTRPRLSPSGQRWLDATLICLQHYINRSIPYDADPDTVKRLAFASHPSCYVLSGLCFLDPSDWKKIWNTIDGSDNDFKQVLITGVYCAANLGAVGVMPIHALSAGGGYGGLMERDWQRNFGQHGGDAARPFPP